jgi:dolichyl-phosphate beta-glucosyltransferase
MMPRQAIAIRCVLVQVSVGMPRLSVVIPAYAEAGYLANTLSGLHRYLVQRGLIHTTEVIVVTADSHDGTQQIARRELRAFPIMQHIEPGAKVGKGRDVRCGMLAARGDIALFMDADLATPVKYIEDAVAAIDRGAYLAIGRRDLAFAHADPVRAFISRASNQLIQTLLLPGLRDTQCGFKAFRREIVNELFGRLETTGWGFDLEVLTRARRQGYPIFELPLPDWADPKGDRGLAGEIQWLAQLRTFRELVKIVIRLGRQPEPAVHCSPEKTLKIELNG